MVMRPCCGSKKRKIEPRDRRFAGAGGTDNGEGASAGNLEIEAAQNLPPGIIGEMHVLEAQRALRDDQRGRVGRLGDLVGLMQDFEHHADVDHRLLHLAIHHAHEIERLVKLDQHGVEHDEIADAYSARRECRTRTSAMIATMPRVKITVWPKLSTASET